MKTNYFFIGIICLCIICTLTSGVYRHDTPIEKYLELANKKEFDCVGRIFKKNISPWRSSGSLLLENDSWKPSGTFILIDSLHLLTAAGAVPVRNTKSF